MSDGYTVAFCCQSEKPVSISLEFVLFASSWRDDCCWWFIKVTFAVLVLFSNVGQGELGSRKSIEGINNTYQSLLRPAVGTDGPHKNASMAAHTRLQRP